MKKHILVWSLTAALLAGAWLVSKATLDDDAPTSPFVTTARVGEQATTRNLAVTVHDVRLANRVTDAAGWSAQGTWLVIDLDAATVLTQESGLLSFARLTVGERTFSATDRGSTFADQRLVTGVPRTGSLAFELADDVMGGQATLSLAVGTAGGDVIADGVIEVPIDLGDLPIEAEATLVESGWAD
ncbi:hypothetical protein AB0269_08190 [Microbacterium sp. NPDC077644]|uniref:hypothetical protein n=1 Tax=Microbacterium sp. NPDC077644 TaxID=3155055 RepID=UPI00344C17E7